MNDEDREAFGQWFGLLGDSHIERVIKLNRGASQKTWQSACEYKNKECSNLMDAMTRTSQNNAKLQAENAKLRECVEKIAYNYDRPTDMMNSARQVLKELKINNHAGD